MKGMVIYYASSNNMKIDIIMDVYMNLFVAKF